MPASLTEPLGATGPGSERKASPALRIEAFFQFAPFIMQAPGARRAAGPLGSGRGRPQQHPVQHANRTERAQRVSAPAHKLRARWLGTGLAGLAGLAGRTPTANVHLLRVYLGGAPRPAASGSTAPLAKQWRNWLIEVWRPCSRFTGVKEGGGGYKAQPGQPRPARRATSTELDGLNDLEPTRLPLLLPTLPLLVGARRASALPGGELGAFSRAAGAGGAGQSSERRGGEGGRGAGRGAAQRCNGRKGA